MALTAIEKQTARQMLKYYSGDIPQIPEDDSRIQAFITASEENKRLLIKQFVRDVILPNEQVQLNNIQNLVATLENRITQMQNYING